MSRGGGQLGRPSKNPHWREQTLRRLYTTLFRELGALYGGPDFEECEEQTIRDECEAMGLPMGYGRVPREPIQLNDYEARSQFRAGRRWK